MKQQKFFVGDVVKRTQNKYQHTPADGSAVIIIGVELDEEDNNIYLRFKESPSEKWDADYFSIVERAWQDGRHLQLCCNAFCCPTTNL